MGDYRRTSCRCILDLLSDVGASMMDAGLGVLLFLVGMGAGYFLALKVDEIKGEGVPFVPWF